MTSLIVDDVTTERCHSCWQIAPQNLRHLTLDRTDRNFRQVEQDRGGSTSDQNLAAKVSTIRWSSVAGVPRLAWSCTWSCLSGPLRTGNCPEEGVGVATSHCSLVSMKEVQKVHLVACTVRFQWSSTWKIKLILSRSEYHFIWVFIHYKQHLSDIQDQFRSYIWTLLIQHS